MKDDDNDEVIIYDRHGDGKLLYQDSKHVGPLYVPKRFIPSNPDFYNNEKWEYVDEKESSINTFTEPMMALYVRRMSFVGAKEFLDEYDFIEWAGAQFKDLHEKSHWGDG